MRGLDAPWIPWRPALTADQDDAPGGTRERGDAGSRGDAEAMAEAGTLDELIVRGPERIALTGPNRAALSTLLRLIAGDLEGSEQQGPGLFVRRIGAVGYLPQRLNVLDDSLTVVENVRAVAPAASVNDVRAGLARFLFRGARADAAAGTLSGGERFRAVLAALLLADPPPQFLLLDEPTNSLDLASVCQLGQALACYQGALLVASHDGPFLGLDRDNPLAPPLPRRTSHRHRPAGVTRARRFLLLSPESGPTLVIVDSWVHPGVPSYPRSSSPAQNAGGGAVEHRLDLLGS